MIAPRALAGSGPFLAVHEGGGRRVVAIDAPVFRIGRGPTNQLSLGAADVSREHAEIVADERGYVIRDRGSRTGTFVNGSQIAEHRLAHGDEIECGRSGALLMFLSTRSVSSRAQAQAVDLRPVAVLLDSLRGMRGDRVLDEVLALVLDAAIEATGAERGFIMLAGADGRLQMTVARAAGRVALPVAGFATSRKVPEQVFATGEAAMLEDLREGDAAAVHTGTVALGIRYVLCVPLRAVHYVVRTGQSQARPPIGVLYLDSRERGRLMSEVVRTDIEALAGEASLAIENARLYQQTLEKARLDRELETASRIQRALLPEPRRDGTFFEAVGASIASRVVGGDFFDYQQPNTDAFQVGIGDITGKGPPAALVTALVQGLLAAQVSAAALPAQQVTLINRVLLARPIESRFLSLFLGVLRRDGALTYTNAGHNPPLLCTVNGVTRLEAGGTLVGAFEDASYDEATLQLADGDTLLLYSDGVSEAENAAGQDFGEDGIRRVVYAARRRSPRQILDALFAELRAFTSGAPAVDDMTAVVVRYRQPG